MKFFSTEPASHLSHLVKQFWIIGNPDPTVVQQKIIPDGYCEIIIHFGDPYRIRLNETWETQDRVLFAGQIRRFFYLENTGSSGMLGIKLMPAAAFALFQREMSFFTDRVVPLSEMTSRVPPSAMFSRDEIQDDERILAAQTWVEQLIDSPVYPTIERTARIAQDLIDHKGMINIEDLATQHRITRRQLERAFKKVIGLSPKYYARIMQFNYIFEAMQSHDNSWVDVALDSGYFDQSHFIRNFRAFTGESPAQYGFDEKNMANFFLRKG